MSQVPVSSAVWDWNSVLWRGSLLPLDAQQPPNHSTEFYQIHPTSRVYDGFAAEREQAPSPQTAYMPRNGDQFFKLA
ncbi:hypothetical protein C1Y11_18595 [Pseudomonas sp. FW305-20]|jgi:hypothetical protein|nr:hypothetical protein PFAS1_09305 [Pseudomonas frederiksbergensis]PMU09183.1 hypothetical protein C1Y11_18595 [Pseudomonas sp. FW305-20]PMU17508.1 hypothetical protein C1Y10_16200 [Pseudomonas sp. FW305-122]PMU38431.1 hypothetical protein C1Y12_16845 [Pseudomonas sp. FW305-47B]PMX59307.1 hypothetical protein C1Y13_18325 [Pseudomonas sp. FW305-33]PMX60299.1 hypothetical protein C1X12_27025 [Pseudomonas sp. FW305-60]